MGIAEKRLRKERLMGLLTDGTRPVSVRNLFYQMVGQGWIEKTDGGYQKVAKCLIEMRRAKEVPYDWISDGTRNPIGATSQYERGVETTIAELLDSCSPDTSLWAYAARQPGGRLKHPQVWIESRSAAGMIEDITRRYEVSLWPTAGHSSLTLLYRGGGRRPTNVAVLTDWDKAGLTIRKNTRKDLRWFGAGAAEFDVLAINPEQAEEHNLPTQIGGQGWQLEALPVDVLREIVENWILGLLPDGKRTFRDYRAYEDELTEELEEIAEWLTERLDERNRE